MARPDKETAVADLVESFQESAGAVLTDYRGLTVKQLQDLRRALGEDANYAVVKNTLTKIAANQAGVEGFDDLLTGPTAIAFINGDVVEAAKGLRDFARTNPALVIKGGILDGNPLDAAEIAKIADLESREVLLAKLAGGMLASLSQAVYLLNAPLAQAARAAGALQAKAEQDPSILRGGAGGPAPAEPAAEEPAPSEEPAAAAEEPASSVESAPAESAPSEESAPAESAPSEESAPAESAPSEESAPAESAQSEESAPAEPAPSAELAPEETA